MGKTPVIDKELYKKQGYLLFRDFLPAAEVSAIRDEAKAIMLTQMIRLGIVENPGISEREFERAMFEFFETDIKSFTNSGKQAQHLISLHRLSLDERIVSVLRELGLDFPNISTRPLLYFNSERLAKKEVYWRLHLHQDWRSMQGSLDSIVVWIPLIDIPTNLGALEIVPGSHVWGLLPSEMEDGYGRIENAGQPIEPISVEVKVGDALFFSSFLAHQSGTNVTDSIRWSCHFRYNNLNEATFIERGYPHPYIYKPQDDLITPSFPVESDLIKVFET